MVESGACDTPAVPSSSPFRLGGARWSVATTRRPGRLGDFGASMPEIQPTLWPNEAAPAKRKRPPRYHTSAEYHKKWRDANRERRAEVRRAYRAKNRERIRELNRQSAARHPETQARNKQRKRPKRPKTPASIQTYRRHWLRRYGLTIQAYEALVASQGGACASCGKVPPPTHRGCGLRIDHCHTTNRVRGLLCNECNVAAGMLYDNAERADALARYLRKVV